MLALLFIVIGFFFLVVGALQFLLCVAVPRLRKYALSAALWWAMWGPCIDALLALAALGIVSGSFILKDAHFALLHAERLPMVLGWAYMILGTIGTVSIATSAAWLHQALVRRLTFALFRLYATVVSAGIGSVFGWCFSWWMLASQIRYGWALALCGMLLVVIGFAMTAYEHSRALRGNAPTKFAWVSPEEFDGT